MIPVPDEKFLPIFLGSDPVIFFKEVGEVEHVAESDFGGDGSDLFVGVGKPVRRLRQTALKKVLLRRVPGEFPEDPPEMRKGDI